MVLRGWGQKAIFEMEIQDRSGWNNGDEYYCTFKDFGTKKEIGVRPDLPLIDISQYGNVKKTTNSPRFTSGTYTWAYRTNDHETGMCMFQVTCGCHKWGSETSSIFVRVKKTILD
jgi:hypothetical protein